MKKALPEKLIKCRIKTTGFELIDNTAIPTGAFKIKNNNKEELFVIVSFGDGWDHISISKETKGGKFKIPTWNDMCFIKDLFFEPEEAVVQYHPRQSEYVNFHPGVLHLWRKQDDSIPTPPIAMV